MQQSIKIEETKEEIYRKNLQDVEKQLHLLKGSEDQRHEDKKDFEEIESQLSKLQDRLCEISQLLTDDFAIQLSSAQDISSSLEQNFNES